MPRVEAVWILVGIGISDWTEWWSLSSGGYENQERFSLVYLDYLKVGGTKEGETAGLDVMSILGQCYTRLSQNVNYIYLKFKSNYRIFFRFFFFFQFLLLYLWHIVLRLGAELELQLPVYTIVMGTQDPSCICDLYGSLWQCWILSPLSEARDQTRILMDTMLDS